ncbi:MAG: mammalian cell entry protein [Betaproteobacteria bacterium CG2_30_59_46]|nr:MAG: mammalian cell entry protein [Betaproteobacteria bacterium CG2_30_59_46]PIQ12919.1 MAG: mammalian cell entry protein [Hydrogenophilales bacterium CG18_big_fil_WC_8_21_14_2_50_58_12]PIX99478.1 MAG: MCE family protein [Hydrogenophilales bacterium CG_4_10_14_3_um_filter_58_23]PJB08056.1 MAG: MCE family protein [Hydrogenophilales bacterium CG_4_9_14_3_um_filter_59_35]
MESKVNFTIVGLFTLTLVAALVAILLWLGTGGRYYKIYDTYYAYMNESVSGLNLNAPVKYRGVEVGNVRDITLDPANSERVRLLLKIERGTPVKEDSVAVLRTQGLTGIAYVELVGGSLQSPLLQAKRDEEYPVIRTGPSLMTRMDIALTSLLAHVSRVSDNVNAVLDEDNRRAFKHSLAQIDTVTRVLAAHSASIEAGVNNASKTLENSARASADLGHLIERAVRSAEAIERLANETSRTAAAVPDTLQGIQLLVDDLRELSASLRRVSDQLERNPDTLLFGKPQPEPGPGE